MSDNFTTRTASLRATLAQIRKLDTKKISINGENIDSRYASLNASNSFTGNNIFQSGIKILPLGTTTMSGQDAYGLSIAPPNEDGTAGGLQLWGVQFSMGDEWSETALKINHPQLALFGTSTTPTTLSFDNANVVEFKTMPDDGSATGVTYDFQSWQWTDDTHTDKTNTAPVQILKNNAINLNEKSILNMGESDDRYAKLNGDNTFTANNTFEQEVILENGTNVEGGNIIVHKDGVLTFVDPDGTINVNGKSGYQYVESIPTEFTNGAIYELGLVEGALNISSITFDGVEDKLVQTCEVWFRTGATAPTITWPTGTYWIDDPNGLAPELLADKKYRIAFRSEIDIIVASISYCY